MDAARHPEPMATACTNELLDLILLKLPTRERVAAAAVCRDWASVATRADSTLWATASLAVQHTNLRSGKQLRKQRKLAVAMMAWATERSPFIRRLRLDMRPMNRVRTAATRHSIDLDAVDPLLTQGVP